MIIRGSATHIPLKDESVQCCVTSPPYWGLRKYAGEQEIQWAEWRGGYGLEPTVEMYVEHSVKILREVRRVLRKDGVCFWNIGDSYNSAASWGRGGSSSTLQEGRPGGWRDGSGRADGIVDPRGQRNRNGASDCSLKPKDLCLIPFRVALAAQADGWWVRSVIIWAKPNPMPESCKDRPTDAYEHILMLTKSANYFWDAEAVAEKSSSGDVRKPYAPGQVDSRGNGHDRNGGMPTQRDGTTRNLRNVWTFPTHPYPEAHFATFPEELPRRCIKAASKVGDVVLDPFGGSGTTGRVAMELNRVPVLLDLAYQGLQKRRTTEVQPQLLMA